MARTKLTMLIELATNSSNNSQGKRIAGWSETVYGAEFGPTTIATFETACAFRAALLSSGATIVGQRYQQVDPVGRSVIGSRQFPGVAGLRCDVPQMTLLVRLRGTDVANRRPWYLRGIPDDIVREGEYYPIGPWIPNMARFFNYLGGYQMLGRVLNAAQASIYTIDSAGNTILEAPMAFVPGDFVRVLRSTGVLGQRIGGRFRVETVTNPIQLKLQNYQLGAAAGGTMRLEEEDFFQIAGSDSYEVSRIIVKKVGKPFFSYRGRASKRR